MFHIFGSPCKYFLYRLCKNQKIFYPPLDCSISLNYILVLKLIRLLIGTQLLRKENFLMTATYNINKNFIDNYTNYG